MSLDQRMRAALDRMSADVDPAVQERFAEATRRVARGRRRRQLAGALTVAAVVLAGAAALPALLEIVHVGVRATGPGAPPASAPPIPAGSYEVTVSRADALRAGVPDPQVEGFAGHYVFTFVKDGSYVWEEATPNPFIKDGGGGVTTHVGDLVAFPDWLHRGAGTSVTVRVVVATSSELRFAVVGASPPRVEPFATALFSTEPWTPTG
jgi:hypothetical protein